MSPLERSNPFPGLRSFEPDEDHLFFGREAQTDELLRRLRATRFLAVVGTSGSGKSSLVRSGLIPALYGGAMSGAGSAWRVAILRPGASPIANLADALAAPEALGDAPCPPDRAFLEASLRASRLGLVESVCEAGLPPGDRLLILADQFEELFRFRQSGRGARDEALAFVRLLLEAARHEAVPVYVALTTRSEYIGHCMEFPDLPEAINDGLYLVPRMTREQLRSAITGPVAVGGGQIALRLVHRLLNDVGDNPDQLPVLQHALMRTWDRWVDDHAKGEPIDLRHYEAVGTLRGALSLHADEAYGELDTRGKEIAGTTFKALTELGPEGHAVRRPAPLRDICALTGASEKEVAAVVESFRQTGRSFLTPPAGTALGAASMLDLSHESLIRIWGKLRGWVQEEARDAREYRDLAGDADRYARGKADLLGGLRLQVALAWRERVQPNPVWALRYDPSYLWTTSFLQKSEETQEQEIAKQERERRVRLRLAWALIAVLAAATVFSSLMWRNARENRKQAEKEKAAAEQAKQEALDQKTAAELAKQEALDQKATADLAKQEALLQKTAAELAEEEALRQKTAAELAEQKALDQKTRAELARQDALDQKAKADLAKQDALDQKTRADLAKQDAWDQKTRAELAKLEAEGQKSRAERLKSLAEARELAARSLRFQQSQELRLAALLAVQAHRTHLANLKGHEADSPGYTDETDYYRALYSVWRRLPGQAAPAPAKTRNARKGPASQEPADPRPQDRELKVAVRAVAFGDAGRIVLGTEDGLLYSYLLFAGETRAVRPFESGVRSLALGPSPEIFAAGSLGGSMVVGKWPLSAPMSAQFDVGNQAADGVTRGAVTTLAFQRKGKWLAAGRADGGVELWDWRNGKTGDHRVLETPGFAVTSLALSDRNVLAAGGKSGVLLWKDLPASNPIQLHRGSEVWALDLSRDGRFLVAGTAAGEILQWDLEAGSLSPTKLVEKGLPVRAVRFSSNGEWLAAARGNGAILLWRTGRPQDPPLSLPGHKSWVWSLDFSPDNQWLVSGGEDRMVRFWPVRPERLVQDVCRHLGRRDLDEVERKRYLNGGGLSPTCPESTSRAEAHGATP